MVSRALFLRMAGALGVTALAAGTARAQELPRPTKAEMLEAIQKGMNETYLSQGYKDRYGNTGITIVTTEPKFGQPGTMQMYAGRRAQPYWPVRMSATVTVKSTKRPDETIVWGGKPGDVWYFHKTSFGEWGYRIGSE
jgi:hypothetical protein